MNELNISGEKANLKIIISGFERFGTTDESDASWLVCQVSLCLPNFTANYEASFTINDFLYFKDNIKKALTCVSSKPIAIFQTDEDMLYIKLEFNLTGEVSVYGIAKVYDCPGGSLSFSYKTYLYNVEQLLKQLEKMEVSDN